MEPMPRPRPPHLRHERNRHGTPIWYVRQGDGPRIRIREPYGSEAFWQAYRDALDGETPARRKAGAGTLEWLVNRYRETVAWSSLSLATRRQRENIFRKIIAAEGSTPFESVSRKDIIAGRDRRKATPAAARHFVETLRGLFQWALDAEHVEEDPTAGVKVKKPRTDGHHTWTDAECDAYEARWPVGTRQRLAFDLLLYTGLRRGDVVRLGRQHIRNGVATLRTEKNGETVTIPLLEPVVASISASQTGDLAFICGVGGEPLTKESFGNEFREWCIDAGVLGRAHGLRKAGATRAAQNGATVAQLEALFGWRGGGMASLYTRKADRVMLATEAATKLLPRRTEGKVRRPPVKTNGNSTT